MTLAKLIPLLLIAMGIQAWASPCQWSLTELEGYLLEWENDVRLSEVRALSFKDLAQALSPYRITLVGDVHSAPEPQEKFIELIGTVARDDRPTFVVIEFLGAQFQSQIDDYLANKISLEQLHNFVLSKNPGYFHQFPWASYSKILIAAKSMGHQVLAFDWDKDYSSMEGRDQTVAQRLTQHALTHPTARYMALYGQAHVLGHEHLYGRLRDAGFDVASVLVFLYSRADLLSQFWPEGPPKVAQLDQNIFWLQTLSAENLKQILQYLEAINAWFKDRN